jgi:hypothetical protein
MYIFSAAVFIGHYCGKQIKNHEIDRHVAVTGIMRNPCQVLVVQLEGKRLLGRPGRRWEFNI